jgi:septation ring formation regulator EzrA
MAPFATHGNNSLVQTPLTNKIVNFNMTEEIQEIDEELDALESQIQSGLNKLANLKSEEKNKVLDNFQKRFWFYCETQKVFFRY